MSKVRIGVVGVGHLGKEHARILSTLPDVELVGVADPSRAQVEAVALRCNTRAFTNHKDLIGKVDAAVVAAPTFLHHNVGTDLLGAGISLLVEKPLAKELNQCQELEQLARDKNLILQVGHIERFNPAYEELVRAGLSPRYVVCKRTSSFPGRSLDVGVVLDLMIHDLDLVLDLVKDIPTQVEAFGASIMGGCEDMAQVRLHFARGAIVDLMASRVHPEPCRSMDVWGAEGYAGVDFAKRALKLWQPGEIFRRGFDASKLDAPSMGQFRAELFTRHLESREIVCEPCDQLTKELSDFRDGLLGRSNIRVTGEHGVRAVALATRILESIERHPWTSSPFGPSGPRDLPAPKGQLFATARKEAAA